MHLHLPSLLMRRAEPPTTATSGAALAHGSAQHGAQLHKAAQKGPVRPKWPARFFSRERAKPSSSCTSTHRSGDRSRSEPPRPGPSLVLRSYNAPQ